MSIGKYRRCRACQSGTRRVAVAFQEATTRCPGWMLSAHGRLGDLGGQRLRRREADPDPAADRRHGHDLDVEMVARRAGIDAARGASAMSHG